MQLRKLDRGELIAVIGGAVLGLSLALQWYSLGNKYAILNGCKGPSGSCTGWASLSILRFVRDSDVVVVDKCFQDASYLQQVGPIADLTRREREVLQWMRVGRHNHEIAEALGVSVSTIGFHVRNLLEKLGARNRVEAINRADLLGL